MNASYMKIMKQWIWRNNIFEQPDHTTVLSILTHFDFESVSSYMTKENLLG